MKISVLPKRLFSRTTTALFAFVVSSAVAIIFSIAKDSASVNWKVTIVTAIAVLMTLLMDNLHRRVFSGLVDLETLVSSAVDLKASLDEAAKAPVRLTLLAPAGKDALRQLVSIGLGGERRQAERVYLPRKGILSSTRKGFEQWQELDVHLPGPEMTPGSYLVVPVRKGDQFVGVISVDTLSPIDKEAQQRLLHALESAMPGMAEKFRTAAVLES